MRTKLRALITAAVLLPLAAGAVAAQSIHVTPALGVYIPASDLQELRSETEQRRVTREGTLGLGLSIEAGWLRGSIAYASGATITEEGVQNREDIGDGSVLTAAADFVYRPLPRLLVQPYLVGGLGLKRQEYSYRDEGFSNPLDDELDVAVHVGIGADVMFGGVGVSAEITDYVTRHQDGGFGQHDAFALIGLRLRLGGSRR